MSVATRCSTYHVTLAYMEEIREYARRGATPRSGVHLRVPDGTILAWKRLAEKDGRNFSAWLRLVIADGLAHRECGPADGGDRAKLVERTEQLQDARALIAVLQAHRCPAPADEDGRPAAPDPLERFYDLDAPDEENIDQGKLIVNAPRPTAPW